MDHTNSPNAPFDAMQRRLRIERRQTAAELTAIDEFVDRLRTIPTGKVAPPVGPPALTDRRPGDGLASVREAYRSTVMAVPHYETEYDNNLADDVAEEFGSTIAAILLEGGPLEEQMKRTLLALAADSRERRVTLLEIIDAERDSVERAAEHLRPVAEELAAVASVDFDAESFGSLDAHRARMDTLMQRCDTAAERRQNYLRDHRTTSALSESIAAVPLYLYQGFEVTFPVLSFVADLGERIDSVRRAIGHAVARYETDDRPVGGDADTRGRTGT